MRITFRDIKISDLMRKHINDALDKNWVSMGDKVKAFENEWGRLFDYRYNVAVSSGTDACLAACATLYDAVGAKRGDEIIVPALSFIATSNAVLAAGFTPVFVDIERETLNINPNKIEEKITSRTKAIMVVHTMGKPCEMDKIMHIANKHNLIVIEEACEAHGAKYKGKLIGHWGDMAAFSFYAAHLVCCGEGGMVSTNNERLANLLKTIRTHGRDGLYFDHVRFGLNLRMNDMEASIGLGDIPNFAHTFKKRKDNIYFLLDKFKDLEKFAYFNLEEENDITAPHAFSITLKDPKYDYKEMYKFFEDNSIMCKRNFGSIPTQHRAFAFMGYKLGDFPEAEYVGDNGLHFGIHRYLSQEDLEYISDVVHKYFERFA